MTEAYDPRYLAGVLFFNDGDFFEAHEVWEDLWHDTAGPDRRFIQGMIQAAVGLLHFANGNLRGATRLYHSSRDYLEPYRPGYLGLDLERFFSQHEHACAGLLSSGAGPAELLVEALPRLELDPPPAAWPNPRQYLPPEDDE